ncbi:hypothetical protein NQ318_020446 [Aromia moschata]|uniref:Peptidase M14 domain-containing protein n=1 Tax=Aromia moschata TaxID=1265417 RepID=A0AAV8YJ07_9CUCU|nr:hypothetical protein NQ318_020446 [Aromia moschata]
MKHPELLVCLLFVVGRVIGRASVSVQDSSPIEDDSPYEIEDIIAEESETAVKTLEPQEQLSEEDAEATPQTRVLYNGNQLWKTIVDSVDKMQILLKLRDENDISTWGGNTTSIDILVKPGSLEKVATTLSNYNIRYEILIDDLQRAIDEENPPVDTSETVDRQGHRLTWNSYHRMDDVLDYLQFAATTYPDLVTLKTIGNSVQGRPIKLVKISNGNPGNKAIWVDGGIHAREWITPATVTYIINYLTLKFESEPDYVQNIDWYIVPVANPDGYEYSHTVDRLWRKNRARSGQCSGTDLNRNFGYKWGGQGSSKNPCSETYGGYSAFSEPETAAIQRFIKAPTYQNGDKNGSPYCTKPNRMILSRQAPLLSGRLTSPSTLTASTSYTRGGYNRVVPPDYKDLEVVATKAAAAIRSAGGPAYTVGPAANTLYPASGGSDDWAKGTMRMKYAYTIELRDNGRYGFVLPSSYINPTAQEALAALRVIAEAAAKA